MTVPYILILALFCALSFVYLFFPKVVQSVAMRAIKAGIASRYRFLVTFVGSKHYLAVLRAVGFMALVAAVILVIALIRES